MVERAPRNDGPRAEGRSPKPRAAATLLLTFVSVAGSLLAAELVLRRVAPLDAGSSFAFRIPHRVHGWVLRPGASYVNDSGDSRVRVRYNSRGFRDVERELAKPEGHFRIVVLGDSFMEGYSVELESSFHRRLEALARERGHPVEVLNLGVGGYGTLQEYLLLREEGWRYEPDLVLLAFFPGNDLEDNSLELERLWGRRGLKARARPFLEPGADDEWQLTQVDYEASLARYEKKLAKRRRPKRWLAERSALFRSLLAAADRVEDAIEDRREAPQAEEDAEDETTARNRRFLLLADYRCREAPEFARAWEITGRVLSRMKREADEAQVPLVVFSVPAKQEVDPATRRALEAEAEDPETLCLEEPPALQRLARELRDREIGFIDLLPAFRRAQARSTELFGVADPHWSTQGHELAASVVIEALAGQELLP